jgi:hypothetical protein
MKRVVYVVSVCCILFSCNNTKTEAVIKSPEVKPANNVVDKLVNEYLALKDAFISNDTTKINFATQAFVAATNIDTTTLGDIIIADKATLQATTVNLKKNSLLLSKGVTVPEKLKVFSILTNDMKSIAKLTSSQNLYVQNCPMATEYSDNDSVFWISNQPKIRNPFYPRTMPSCGLVVDTLVQVK